MAALTEGRRRLVGDRSAAVSFRKKSDVRWLACRGCHGMGDDDLIGNLRGKAPAMSLALGRSGQRRGDRSECRSRGGVDEQRREREGEVLCSDDNFTLLLRLQRQRSCSAVSEGEWEAV
jgi:hypothetical protein